MLLGGGHQPKLYQLLNLQIAANSLGRHLPEVTSGNPTPPKRSPHPPKKTMDIWNVREKLRFRSPKCKNVKNNIEVLGILFILIATKCLVDEQAPRILKSGVFDPQKTPFGES